MSCNGLWDRTGDSPVSYWAIFYKQSQVFLRKLNRPSSLLVSEVANAHLIGSFEDAFETGSVLCRSALWDCFGERILTQFPAQPRIHQ